MGRNASFSATFFWFAEGSDISSAYLPILILLVAFLKFIGIGTQFMELKHANSFWLILFSFFIVIFCGLVWFVI